MGFCSLFYHCIGNCPLPKSKEEQIMGEAYEMYEDGLVDEMGEYIGDGMDYREVSAHTQAIIDRNSKIRNFMKQRGITTKKAQKRALKLYGEKALTHRPTFHADKNWQEFKDFINERVNYKKPNHETI